MDTMNITLYTSRERNEKRWSRRGVGWYVDDAYPIHNLIFNYASSPPLLYDVSWVTITIALTMTRLFLVALALLSSSTAQNLFQIAQVVEDQHTILSNAVRVSEYLISCDTFFYSLTDHA